MAILNHTSGSLNGLRSLKRLCKSVIALQLLINALGVAAASEPYWPSADTSAWSCRLCPEQSQREGRARVGLGHVSQASSRFGDYRGLEDSGVHVLADLAVQARNAEGGFADLQVNDGALDARSASLLGGRQGVYGLAFHYNQTPHIVTQGAQTVFSRAGAQTLRLPELWEPASTTQSMSRLQSSLDDVAVRLDRDRYAIGATARNDHFWGEGSWDWGVDYRRIEQEGTTLRGGSFLNTTSILPVPVDRVTEQMNVQLSYQQDSWQAQLAYYGSLFHNKADFVIWDNPFTPLAAGADRGQLAQEPDNRFHQLMFTGSWRPGPAVQASARLAVGRAQQDAAFLAPTLNPTLSGVDTPRESLDGEVATLNGHLRLRFRPSTTVTFTGEAYHDNRDNRTPRNDYVQLHSDIAVASSRRNQPYSFERSGAKARTEVKVSKAVDASAGVSREVFERTFQDAAKTETSEYWGELAATPSRGLDLRLWLGQERRRVSHGDAPLAGIRSNENPLLRRYHLGERDRNQARAGLTYEPLAAVTLGLSLDYADDHYRKTAIGLTQAYDVSQTVDLHWQPRDSLTFSSFYSRQHVDAKQAGSEGFTSADWTGRQKDVIRTFGVGLQVHDLREGLDAGLDVSDSFGRGDIETLTRNNTAPFPTLKSRLTTLNLFTRYRFDERFSVRVDYEYERYNVEDFFYDKVDPGTVATLLSVGRTSPNDSVHFAGLSVIYRF